CALLVVTGFARFPGEPTALEDEVGEAVDLFQRGDCGVEVELGDPDRFELRHRVTNRGIGPDRAFGEHLGVLAQETVVVAQVCAGVRVRLLAEREVDQRGQPRLVLSSGVPPGGAYAFQHRAGLLRGATNGRPTCTPGHRARWPCGWCHRSAPGPVRS